MRISNAADFSVTLAEVKKGNKTNVRISDLYIEFKILAASDINIWEKKKKIT